MRARQRRGGVRRRGAPLPGFLSPPAHVRCSDGTRVVISFLPWSKAASAVEAVEKDQEIGALRAAREAVSALAERQSIPGVKKKLAELEERFMAARNRAFESALEHGDLEGSLSVHRDYPRASSRVEERVRLAAAALAVAADPPSLADISVADVRYEWRSAYFDARSREAERLGDRALQQELLSLWIQNAPDALDPHARLCANCILIGQPESALYHIQSMASPLKESVLGVVLADASLAGVSRAWIAIHTGLYAEAVRLLDEILTSSPQDEWAIGERVRIAEAAGDWALTQELYERWSALRPGESSFVRKLAEIALATGDAAACRRRLQEAWELGDVDAGLALAQRLIEEGEEPVAVEGLLDSACGAPLASTQLVEIARCYLALGVTDKAADRLRTAFQSDRYVADTVIGLANTYVQQHLEKRLPLLALLIDVGPVRGFPADPYKLMAAEDLIEEGRQREARPHLEELLATSLRWRSLAALAKMVMAEPAAAKEQMLRRIEAALPEADRVGRAVWAEMSYAAAVLAESAGLKDVAVARLDELMARELDYRDCAQRLERLRAC